jgi:hypothetical protein
MSALLELVTLFVEDGSLAVAILVLVGIVKTLLLEFGLKPATSSFFLLFGLLVLLLENVFRSARKIRAEKKSC